MIQGLTTATWTDFRGGRVTNASLAAMLPETCLIAQNIFFLGDKAVSKRNGYTLVKNVWAGPLQRIYDFQRDLDGAQFVMVNGNGNLGWIPANGSAFTSLSTTESAVNDYDFAKNLFALYLTNGLKQYRGVDWNGTGGLVLKNWGMTPPATAPTVAAGSGTLNLIYGRQYVYCPVSKYTDATGTTRVSAGAPSPISANIGPQVNAVINVAGIPGAPTDLQITHWWIFATVDSAFNTSSTYYFAAEIAVGTTTWGDALLDADLDTTRLAPWSNYPPPLAKVLIPYQSRIVALGIPGSPHLVQLSGLEEIDLGIPEEAWPPDLAFEVPGGDFELIGGIEANNALMLATNQAWFMLTGYDASTFAKQDFVIKPGLAGKKALCTTPKYLVWLGTDKHLWGWDYVNDPVDMSRALGKPLANFNQLSMDDLSTAQLANAEVRYYAFGRYKFVVVLASSNNQPGGPFDWIQIWDASWVGLQLSDGSTHYLSESDMFPANLMTCSGLVEVASALYLFMADANGNIYRFPDGFTDNGTPFIPLFGSPFNSLSALYGQMFRPLDPADIVKRLYWLDLITDRDDTIGAFGLQAIAADAPDLEWNLIDVPLAPLMRPYAAEPKAARCNLQGQPGTAIGAWFRFVLQFPGDNLPATVFRFSIANSPVFGVNP